MMQRRSPPKHRHDGTSPLPLGMDWSPPPRKWNGRETVWPHDPQTGWSYSVTIPSWVVLPKARDSDPVVFYRVQVGLQSPEGVTTTRGVLRRFNDFLKLFTELKTAFPKKSLPPAPPKGLLRMKSRVLLEERRCSLEEWMTKLLSDIDLSRSVTVASFLELEAAARSAFQEVNKCSSEPNVAGNSTISSNEIHPSSNTSHIAGCSSVTSDYGSDTAYETSELGSPRLGRDNSSDIGLADLTLDEDLSGSIENFVKYGMSNIDEGLSMGQTILEQLEDFPKHKTHHRNINKTLEKDTYNGNGSRASFLGADGLELFSEPEPAKTAGHARKLSTESVGSDVTSLRGSDTCNFRISNSSCDLPGTSEVLSTMGTLGKSDLQFSGATQIVLPLDQRHKMNRFLLTMQQGLVTAKTDMEDLIARLNQEIAVKGYLTTKVRDLEVELESTKQKSKENLQQALLIERERFTQMQWEMEELRRKLLEMQLKLNPKQDEMQITETTNHSAAEEKDAMLQELNASKEQLNIISKQYEELETKSKAEIKVLVKEVKSLRKSEKELKQEVDQSLSKISEVEVQLEHERQTSKHVRTAREKLLNECQLLHNRLLECNVNLSIDDDENVIKDSSLVEEALDLLTTSDDKITVLLAEVQLLAKEDSSAIEDTNNVHDNHYDTRIDDELRKIIADIFTDNAKLRKQLSTLRHSWKQKTLPFVAVTRGKGHSLLIVESVLNNSKSSINDNGAAESAKVLLERLFAQTQKLEQGISRDGEPLQDFHLALDLQTLESDLLAALTALKQKEDDLQDAEKMVVLEQSELSRAKDELEQREKEIAAASSKHEKLEEKLTQANLAFASQASQIEDLKLQLKEQDQKVAAAQSALSAKEDEMDKMRHELVKKTEEAEKIRSELTSKSQLLNEANEVMKKQEIELQELREAIWEREEELETSLTQRKLEEEKLKVAEAKLQQQTMEWLLAQEELKKLAEQASRHMGEANETFKDFTRVKQLLSDVRSELVSSQKSLASSRQQMEQQEQLLKMQLDELEEQRKSVASYMESLKNAQIEVESERVKLRVVEARNKDLERDLSVERELIKELQEELKKEKYSLQLAIQDASFLRKQLGKKHTEFVEMSNVLQNKEVELVEAKLEIQHLKSERASLQLILEEKDQELSDAKKNLEQLNQEIAELKMLMSSKENQLIQATALLKEKDEYALKVQDELNDTKMKFSEAETVIERIAELTNRLVISVKDEDNNVLRPVDDVSSELMHQLVDRPFSDFGLQKKQLETELRFTKESLKDKEMEVLAAQRALAIKDEELKMVLGRLEAREKELQRLKEEMTEDANDMKKLYALAQERIGEKSIGDLAIEKLQLEAAQLEVEAATSALQKLAEMSHELLIKASTSIEADSDTSIFLQSGSNPMISMMKNDESFTEVKTGVARLSALSEQLVKDAGIVGAHLQS